LPGPAEAWGFILAVALVCAPAQFAAADAAQNQAAGDQARFEREKDPVHKAKMMQRLGADEFEEIRRNVNDGNLSEAVRVLDRYRDQARSCIEGLDAKHVNSAKHSSGFKQLQISLQEALRRLDEIIAGLTSDEQPPFLAARGDLSKMNDDLVHELFPDTPTGNPPAEKDTP
jgi:hypothetical protein